MVAIVRADRGDRSAMPGEGDGDAGPMPWSLRLARITLAPVLFLFGGGSIVVAASLGIVVAALAIALLLPLLAVGPVGLSLFVVADVLTGGHVIREMGR